MRVCAVATVDDMKTTARLTHEKIRFDAPKELHLAVELRAPSVDWQKRRPPVCVLPVIDVSGSMQGAKLHYAKQSVMKLVDHLAPGDFFGLVTFTDEIATLAPPAEMTQPRKGALKAVVGQLEPTREVDEVVALAQLVRAQIEAETRARGGEFGEAKRVMHQLLLSLRSRGRASAAVACERVMATVANSAAYADSAAFRTSMKAGVTRGSRGSKHAEAVAVLCQAGVQLSTGAQDAMADRFEEKKPKTPHKPRTSGGLTRKRSKRW